MEPRGRPIASPVTVVRNPLITILVNALPVTVLLHGREPNLITEPRGQQIAKLVTAVINLLTILMDSVRNAMELHHGVGLHLSIVFR